MYASARSSCDYHHTRPTADDAGVYTAEKNENIRSQEQFVS